MVLSARTRRWLRAASEDSLSDLRQELVQLGQELAECRRLAAESEAALSDQIAQARAENESLRDELRALAQRLDEQAQREEAQAQNIDALRGQWQRAESATDEIRLKMASLAEQYRWENEDMRKAVVAIAERTRLPV